MDFDDFTRKYEATPPTFSSERQVSASEKIFCLLQRIVSTFWWGMIALIAAAVIADAL